MRMLLIVLFATLPVRASDFPTFMTGHWRTTSPVLVEEHWTSAEGDVMVGLGRTVPASGRTKFEFLRITRDGGKLTYIAMPSGKQETPFPMKEITETRVVFENPDHDYPRRITYWRDGEQLCARIEGKDGANAEQWCFARF